MGSIFRLCRGFKNRSLNTLSEVIEQNFIFVCLPTPMRYGGECDLSILDNFFEGLPDNITGTFVIKSTVPIGTTKKYYERHNVIHNPEFLTARNAIQDFANSRSQGLLFSESRGLTRKPGLIYTGNTSGRATHENPGNRSFIFVKYLPYVSYLVLAPIY